ncbi:Membrane-bound O-acyltransferase GUP1 [Erysiphe necator]|uniref:Putative mboat family protein n=1 Tax=Uncinula necator TaxID=52586 RepID=A0A0B1P2T2_UNCNE|nr:Membrane-bound O-acyltransferase GUP1 [Erysiphe necator]KHJ31221.1 putative mboat family protein [Erysiphe necator]
MSFLSYLRSLYYLDTLDTRFTNPSSTPYKTVIEARKHASGREKDHSVPGEGVRVDFSGRPVAQPSKLKTTEFYFYYVVFIVIVPYMFWVAYDVSRPSDPNYHKFEHLLSPGWVPGRKIDTSDAQYSTFRENLPFLGVLIVAHPLLRKIYNFLRPIQKIQSQNSTGKSHKISEIEGNARLHQRVTFDVGFAFLYLTCLHGFSIAKIFFILYINYKAATKLPRNLVPATTWILNISILFANELCSGYKYARIAEFFTPVRDDFSTSNWGTWLDGYGGLISRWEILFNITVLRLISFNLDYYWSLGHRSENSIEKKQLDALNLSERDRITIPANPSDYSFRNYLAYSLYAPLYLAGPIITFNDYISQTKHTSASIETSRTIKYGFRFLLCLLATELFLHLNYCVAISKGNPNWLDYTAAQLSLLSYFNLHVLWLKLLLPWRLFRLWSLIDQIDPPENMIRCLSDHPSTIAFWRGWHRSFNRWLIRYLYGPLGGASSKTWKSTVVSVFNYAVVFTFVALWHDISLNLLIWGWLIVLFMLPEVILRYLFPRRRWENHLTIYRVMCGFAVVGNLMMMMMANLVGFAVGVDGLKTIIYGIFRDHSGYIFLFTSTLVLFVGIQVMFEVRESEMRKGIFLKC